MKDEPPAVIPTAQDKVAAEFENITRVWKSMADQASQLAKTRKALFDAYVKEGFTEAQALDLIRGSLML
jgi:hypothetical protein